jgi:cyclopropane-fatty-acyl-phospholipid synthase
MYEHVGIDGLPEYFRGVRSLLVDRGVFLNHGITRRAKTNRKRMRRIGPGRRLILKYVFPGSDLDDIGHSIELMEAAGLEVHDVEGWRDHYAATCREWCQRLSRNQEEAVRLVGSERYRLWVAYLAGVSVGFREGSLRIFQTVATRHQSRGPTGMPRTRGHLYPGSNGVESD